MAVPVALGALHQFIGVLALTMAALAVKAPRRTPAGTGSRVVHTG